ncbi:MAG: MBL fold metallo-hydrolase [Clostridia bacterium]|nr:MBL fold metallo-hydrolase [Clostridia bacterium]
MNVYEICPGVLQIEEDYRVYCALVAGETGAVLWDTGLGKKDLRSFVRQRVGRPCLVLNSHGHADHTGGNRRFPEVRLAREDWPLLGGAPDYALMDLPAGAVFDLGGITAECVSLAGHTPGSRGLLLREKRLLLAGDALDPRLRLPENSLDTLRETLTRAWALPFDAYLTGHGPKPLGKDQVEAHLRHLAELTPDALEPVLVAGVPARRSEWRQGGLRSVFILSGQPAS